ncbi:fatty acyl-AMP ligase [Amycolatopsis magusensis]|uniref:Acyl-CoA synthetase (AMP-forming)/AMP-acid ligase II n=1 Tax=Amycolatopsis magusensis TaxID=882444 RepID=A0ABS4PXN6_9PSEU|nr:fatty acyl-AMP ligase [Amycolatopsis magusensis]MBP2183594.1 acyl-CoA synthetase (AMP-forming)/AMP-acid ligase II [Amycolatopsis magusensis]
MKTLTAAIHEHATAAPADEAAIYVPDRPGSGTETVLTYGELDLRACAVAEGLRERYPAATRVLLLYPAGTEFLVGFTGCLYAGMLPVPAPLPAANNAGQLARLDRIIAVAEPSAVLTDAAHLDRLTGELAHTGLAVAATDGDTGSDTHGGPADWQPPEATPETPAFLQFTSGSTTDPKGVVISHANLESNLALMKKTFALPEHPRLASWLPHYHDMGLIVVLLMALRYGGRASIMSPTGFLRDPFRWLEIIDKHGVHLSPAPNFAYDLCVRRVDADRARELDLSRWRVAINGAEPVQRATMAAFQERFGPAGLGAHVQCPCYGMAEVGVFITGTPAGTPATGLEVAAEALERNEFVPSAGNGPVRSLMSSGVTPPGFGTLVVDPDTREPLPDGRIGEIWLRGPSVGLGYWQDPETTAATFGGRTADGRGPYLRTGDLGVLTGDRLYLTGRLKELIIIHGRNLYPHDLEHHLRSLHPALADGLTAAFAVPCQGTERIVVVHEAKAGDRELLAELGTAVKAGLSAFADASVANVAFVGRGGIRRSTSGKIRRRYMRQLFMTAELGAHWEDLEPAVRILYRIRAEQTAR